MYTLYFLSFFLFIKINSMNLKITNNTSLTEEIETNYNDKKKDNKYNPNINIVEILDKK